MYSVTVSDSMMIAHSLDRAVFGPARRLHGATYVVEVEIRRPDLDDDNIVVDIGRAQELLADVLAPLDYQNLDALPDFAGRITSTEFLARAVFERYRQGILDGELGDGVAPALAGLVVTLREKPNAWASYAGPINAQSNDGSA